MPSKLDKVKLTGLQDRRRKLTEGQKEEIRRRYAEGRVGQRPLAQEYGVSRRLIQIITNEETAQKIKRRGKEHWKEYSNREDLTKATRALRHYKKELHEKGELEV